MAKPTPVNESSPPHRLERVFAYIFVALVGLSIACFVVVLIASASDPKGSQFKGGFWQAVALLPGIGLPVAFAIVIVLLVLNIRRRARESQSQVKNKK